MSSPTNKVTSTRSERREEIRDTLLAIVETLLEAGETYTSITVERLAAEAGMSRTRFYMYFEDKGDLLHAWLVKLGDESQAIFDEWWEREGPVPREVLRAVLERYVVLCREHRTLLVAMQDAASVDSRLRGVLDRFVGEHIARFETFIRRGQEGGWIAPGLDAGYVAGWLGWMEERGLPQLVGNGSPDHLAHVADSYTAIIWKTLYGPA